MNRDTIIRMHMHNRPPSVCVIDRSAVLWARRTGGLVVEVGR
jgi:hypothetical protein